MSTLTVNPQVKKAFCFLPEIWYTIFLVASTIETGRHLLKSGGSDRLTIVLFIISLCLFGLLIRQFFKENGWVKLFMGGLFALGSFYMSLAVLSEYHEFPLKTEPKAIRLITVGGLLYGASLLLGIWMLVKGIRKIYS